MTTPSKLSSLRRSLSARLPVLMVVAVLVASIGLIYWTVTKDNGGTAQEQLGTPAPSASASETSAAEADAAPVLPAAAQQPTEAGAKAFTQHWLDVLAWSFRNGQTEQLLAISDRAKCQACTDAAATITEMVSQGKRSVNSPHRVTKFVTEKSDGTTRFLLGLDLAISPEAVVGSDGKPETEMSQATTQRASAILRWDGNRWVMEFYKVES